MAWKNGDVYVGNWENGLQSGQGKLTKKNKDIIEGQFRNGKMDGQIIIHYADGSKFRGMYRDGKRNGAAIEQDKKGIRFEVLTVMMCEMGSLLKPTAMEKQSHRDITRMVFDTIINSKTK